MLGEATADWQTKRREGTRQEILSAAWAAARESGQVLVSGLDLLVHQAELQFAEFTGQQGPLEAMRTAGEVALANR